MSYPDEFKRVTVGDRLDRSNEYRAQLGWTVVVFGLAAIALVLIGVAIGLMVVGQ